MWLSGWSSQSNVGFCCHCENKNFKLLNAFWYESEMLYLLLAIMVWDSWVIARFLRPTWANRLPNNKQAPSSEWAPTEPNRRATWHKTKCFMMWWEKYSLEQEVCLVKSKWCFDFTKPKNKVTNGGLLMGHWTEFSFFKHNKGRFKIVRLLLLNCSSFFCLLKLRINNLIPAVIIFCVSPAYQAQQFVPFTWTTLRKSSTGSSKSREPVIHPGLQYQTNKFPDQGEGFLYKSE